MLKQLILAIGVAVALAAPAGADPQKFSDQAAATKFCKEGNVVWYNPDSKIYFPPGSQFCGKTKAGVYTWTIGKDGPFKFYLRATAVDRAGNVGTDSTRDAIVVDLEVPRVEIRAIEPIGGTP